MIKPIVVIMPKADREALQTCGALPASMFSVFGDESGTVSESLSLDAPALYLWKHEIDYRRGAELAARIADRPADIPVFFGMAEAEDDDQKQANEVEITRLLDSVVVHLVFLDNREDAGRGYAEFRSFAEIAAWSRDFNKVLKGRFPNENALRSTENVLVIVARGEMIKVSQDELNNFNGCIGEFTAFKSCYFLDYNLSVDKSGTLFHSRAVWNVMVGRLLLGFLLSQEKDGGANSSLPIWLKPGIKIWRAAECVAEVSEDFIKKQVEKALGTAFSLLQNFIDNDKVAQKFSADTPVAGLENWELTPGDVSESETPSCGWSEFQAEACASKIANPGRWIGALKAVRQVVAEWKQRKLAGESDGGQESQTLFQLTHDVPGRVFPLTQGLFAALAQDRAALGGNGADELQKRWDAVVVAEQERRATLLRLQKEAAELSRAQNHYVGLGFGLVVVAAISVMCGWVLHQLIIGLNGNIIYSIWLAGVTALGAFGAFCLVHFLHWRNGCKGTLALIETCRAADTQMRARHAKSKEIIEAAISTRARIRRMNRRFRAWTLLERIKAVVISEIQPETALVAHEEPTEITSSSTENTLQRRRLFERLTRKAIGPLKPSRADFPVLDKEVREWWEEERSEGDNFHGLWRQLCKIDRFNAGHFPVSVFVRTIREFVSRFNNHVQNLVMVGVLQDNQEVVKTKLLAWLINDILKSSVRQFVSGSIDSLQDCEDRQQSAMIFVQAKQDELDSLNTAINQYEDRHGGYILVPSNLLSTAGQLSFMYQEFVVEFDRNKETGHLIFKEVPDAS